VTFLGALPQSGLPALYRRAAVFVAPFVQAESGDQEGLPVALMEAIACGCPVIAGDVAGLHDLLGEHARDVALDPRDGGELAARIGHVLSHPGEARDRALRMGAYVRQRFDWETIAGSYGAILAEAAGR
jgi:glycosyltransferase involved in cell wall biosynthesis